MVSHAALIVSLALNSTTVSVLVGIAGAFGGLVLTAVLARQRLHRATIETLKTEIAEEVGRLGEPQGDESIKAAVEDELRLLREVEEIGRRELAQRRLLFGYLVLALTGLSTAGVAVYVSEASIHVGALVWAGIALVVSGILGMVLFSLARSREISVSFPASFERALELDAVLAEPAISVATRRSELVDQVRSWLDQQRWVISKPPADSGVDLIARRGDEVMLVEIKAGSRLGIKDVDALSGAARRLSDALSSPKAALFAPLETLQRASRVKQVARADGIDLFAVTPSGEVERLDAGESSSASD